MKKIFSLLLIAVMSVASMQAIVENKTYSVKSASAVKNVTADNQFGNIRVEHWNKKTAEISVIIRVKAESQKRIDELLSRIEISLNDRDGELLGRTRVDNLNSRSEEEVSIDYTIKLPADCPVALIQKFGDITMPATAVEAKARVEVEFGGLKGGNFARELTLKAAHGSVKIDYAKTADIKIQFCKNTEIKEAGELSISGEHSGLQIGKVASIDGGIKFSGMDIRSVGVLSLGLEHSTVTLDEATKSIRFNSFSFSTLKVGKLNRGVTLVDVPGASHSTVRITLDGSFPVNIDSSIDKFSNINLSDEVKNNQSNSGNATKFRFSGSFTTFEIR